MEIIETIWDALKGKKNPRIKRYDGQNWTIQIILMNRKKGINILLCAENINQLIIYNDIECYSPRLELKYLDLGLTLGKILDSNNLQMRVNIIQPPPNPNDPLYTKQNALTLNLLFNVEKVETLIKQNTNTMYQFFATHANQSLLLKNANYATLNDLKDTKETKESPLSIINKLLSKVKYPYDSFYNDSTQRINYITSQTMNVRDAIDQLLRKAVSLKDPPTYFVHNLKTGNAMLINNKKKEERLENPVNHLKVYGNPDSKPQNVDVISQATDITNHSFCTGKLAQRYLSTFTFRAFDQKARKWVKTFFNYYIVNRLFNGEVVATKEYEDIFPVKQSIDGNGMNYDFPCHNEQKMYLFLRELQLGTNSISFNVGGIVTRDAGQYVHLTCSNESQIPKYEGLWHIYSCEHKWSGVSYTNNIVCYRTFAKPAVKNEQNENKETGA